MQGDLDLALPAATVRAWKQARFSRATAMPKLSGLTALMNEDNWVAGNRYVAAKWDATVPIETKRWSHNFGG
jgi:hypothetical protein